MKSKKPLTAKGKTKILSSNLFPVVGIGASAGGLDAFKKLLKAISEESGMAYIIVQHLDPAHDSILAELLQKVTRIPVEEISDNIKVQPNHIYIIPSNKLLTATDGVLQLSARLPKNQRNMPIDLFFQSLAEVHQNHAIGVVLSGTASDGTLGLKAIKNHGGTTFAQDQESAAYDGMPQSAIDAGVVDFVLSPDLIPQQLLKLNTSIRNKDNDAIGSELDQEEAAFKQIISLIRVKKGVDFTYYKQTTIRRRISRRIALCMKNNIGEYVKLLSKDIAELDTLYQDLLIPVTQFFRDPKVFDYLCENIFPEMVKDISGNEPLRIWIAGCSTGEEAYSLAICFHEFLVEHDLNIAMQIFATDISEPAIAKARSGLYKKKETSGLSPARLEKYFTQIDGQVRLNKNIRDSCVFAFHNYLKDPPFAKINLISCRNSLIYLEPFLQKKAFTTFHYSLKTKGYLVLGKSETAASVPDLFNVVDKTNKVFGRKQVKGNFLQLIADNKVANMRSENHAIGPKETGKDDFIKSGDDLMLSKYVPPGVIVNDQLDIVQYRGATGSWLEPSPGPPTLNILKMAREGLSFELRSAILKVKKNKVTVIKENIPIIFTGKERLVTIEVISIPNTIEQYFLILFKDTTLPQETEPDPTQRPKRSDKISQKLKNELGSNQRLRRELAEAREDMREVTEIQETANEELQSANEELLSGSEELQSLNEELETSKEEVQTSNEELIIVNQELFDRNEQLNISRLFAESIVTTIREPLLILTKELKVKTANKAFYEKFQVKMEATIGQSLFDIEKKQWNIQGLKKMLGLILPQQKSILDFELKYNFPGSGERVMLFNATPVVTSQNEEPCILIAFEDITELKKAELESKLFGEDLEKKVLERTLQLEEAHNNLQQSHDYLNHFAYIASHDLQEPLRKIRTFSTILHNQHLKELSEPVQGLVGKINSSAERLSTMVRELNHFLNVIHDEVDFEETDLNEVVARVTTDFDLLINERKVVIRCGQLPIVDAIPFQIDQLFYQLISNAIKFSDPEETPMITITSKILTVEEEAKYHNLNPQFSYCEIAIKDNGIGFNPKYAEKIFLVFNRLHNGSRFSGTGVGLALCKTIVANHHGQISASSKSNNGSLFKIILPLKR